MNFYPNPYFAAFYQQPCLENGMYAVSEISPPNEEIKYVRILESQNKLLREKIESLEEKLKYYQELERQSQPIKEKKKIAKKEKTSYSCTYPNCDRLYKSTLALNLHIKMKHNGGSIREREAYAKLIIQCQRENKPRPEININFPPNFLEDYRKKMQEAENMMKQSST